MLPAIESMMANYGRGDAANLTRRKIFSPDGYLAVMGGGLFYDGVFGVKTFTFTANGYSFQVSLYDATSGRLLLYTQANRLGQLRTGATTGATLRLLANTRVPRLGVIGTGNQAGDQLRAACAVCDVGEIYAYSRNAERRQAFATRMAAELDRPVIAADTNRDAVADCAVVIGIAPAATPVVEGEWLADGATVIGAGPTTPRSHEVDAAVLTRASRLFVDSLEQAPLECGDINAAVDQGLVHWSRFHELRHVAAGVVPGRTDSDEIIYCKLMGTGLADVAAAKLVWERAEELDVGIQMDW
jgi:ornithine cyclodeaminase/alanine dehydrogenase-like protein (mu-crystallin family)